MRVPTWILIAVLALGFCLAGSAPPAVAQGGAKTVWEYRVFRLDKADYKDKVDYQAILRSEGRKSAEAAFYQRVLTYLGKEGWELVTLERRGGDVAYLYLKRRG
jgi:hypothetical protein